MWRTGRKLGWPHCGLMCLYWLVFTSNNNFILHFEDVWKVKEVQESASWRSKAHPSLPEAVLTQSTKAVSCTEAQGKKWRAGQGVQRNPVVFNWELLRSSQVTSFWCAGAYLGKAFIAVIMIKSQPVSYWTHHFPVCNEAIVFAVKETFWWLVWVSRAQYSGISSEL